MSLTIYHNPRCSKSRQTLALIREAGEEPNIRLYLDAPLTEAELRALLGQLGYDGPRPLLRKGEVVYKSMALKTETDEAALIAAMLRHPKLIERPIVSDGRQAIIGRPPEAVKALL